MNTANEGVVPIYVFPEMKLCSHVISKTQLYVMFCLSIPTLIYLRDLNISRIGLSILLHPNMWTYPGNI